MRKIKFRAWNKKNKEFIFLGGLRFDNFGYYINHKERYVICQFIGLKDEGKKEIYEGDIVRFFPYRLCKSKKWKTMAINGQVIFNNNSQFCIRYKDVKDEGEFSDYLFPIECEVIGNIYENPELLKWKKN